MLRDGGSHASFALEVAKANFLFEFVVVALNAPAQLDDIDELTEANVLAALEVTSRNANPHTGKA